ncbi:MAG: hypothetical protein MZV70_73185 [Desulfobacterales bacterium]|nr:hypothetical protein [Desulfobacterales bacterium]
MEEFTASVAVDARLYREDIDGSIAHARMLAMQGMLILPRRPRPSSRGSRAIQSGHREGGLRLRRQPLEDVHMNIEAELTRRIGEAGKKLHTAQEQERPGGHGLQAVRPEGPGRDRTGAQGRSWRRCW